MLLFQWKVDVVSSSKRDRQMLGCNCTGKELKLCIMLAFDLMLAFMNQAALQLSVNVVIIYFFRVLSMDCSGLQQRYERKSLPHLSSANVFLPPDFRSPSICMTPAYQYASKAFVLVDIICRQVQLAPSRTATSFVSQFRTIKIMMMFAACV